MFEIKSDRLRVEMAHPNEVPNITTRFDRAGFITEIVLDGVHRFCATEPNNLSHPSSGGRGLCSEYVFDVSAEAKIGEPFPKFGVGLLKKFEDAPYKFWERYDAEPYNIRVEDSKDGARFITEPRFCMGYAISQKKDVWVKDNRLIMQITVKNEGEKPVSIREYCHNFLTINSMALGPDYKIRMDSIKDMGKDVLNGQIKGDGHGFTFAQYSPSPASVKVPLEEIQIGNPKIFEWSMINEASGARIDVKDEIDICGMTMWCADHIVSVEAFHKLELAPGQSNTWQRTWIFDNI
jgi:LEA14-like dessication related protein